MPKRLQTKVLAKALQIRGDVMPLQTHSTSPRSLWTVGTVLQWVTQKFREQKLDTPLLDAQILLGHVLGCDRVGLYVHYDAPLREVERERFRGLVKERLTGKPVAYLVGQRHWYDLTFFVDERVLIPRPETECLMDVALTLFPSPYKELPLRCLDLGTGSGCLAITLAKKFPQAQVTAVDISAGALDVARKNAEDLGVASQVTFVCENMLQTKFEPAWDIVLTNPPYVTEDDWKTLSPEVRDFEPKLALTCEDNGLFLAKKLVEKWNAQLNNDTRQRFFMMELGPGQARFLATEFCDTPCPASLPFSVAKGQIPLNEWFLLQDLDGNERFLSYVSGSPAPSSS
jgi:release factor glutamine methyltransferase